MFAAYVAKVKQGVREISCEEFDDVSKREGATVIDVREASEFQGGSLPGALHLSKGLLEAQIEKHVSSPFQPIILFCAAGGRAAIACDSLQRMGYTNVFSLKGGVKGWKEAGRELVLSSN